MPDHTPEARAKKKALEEWLRQQDTSEPSTYDPGYGPGSGLEEEDADFMDEFDLPGYKPPEADPTTTHDLSDVHKDWMGKKKQKPGEMVSPLGVPLDPMDQLFYINEEMKSLEDYSHGGPFAQFTSKANEIRYNELLNQEGTVLAENPWLLDVKKDKEAWYNRLRADRGKREPQSDEDLLIDPTPGPYGPTPFQERARRREALQRGAGHIPDLRPSPPQQPQRRGGMKVDPRE